MKKYLVSFVVALFALPLFALSVDVSAFFHEPIAPSSKKYVMNMNIYDWGAAVDALVINLGRYVSSTAIHKEDFEVGVFGAAAGSGIDIVTGYREVTDAYLCDERGNKVDEKKGFYIALSLSVHPDDSISNPFVSFPASILKKGIKTFRLRNNALSIDYTQTDGINCDKLSKFRTGFSVTDDILLHYADYFPEIKDEGEKVPLIIWLHGIAEGGSDALAPLVACRVAEMTGEEIQSEFGVNGAALLVPQSRTSWLESTTKDSFGNNIWVPVDIDGTVSSIKSKIINKITDRISIKGKKNSNEKAPTATVSYYTVALKNLIAEYLEKHSEIDEKRIYLMGVSAGGYMSINMLLQYPDYFAAAVVASEVYPDSKLTEADIEELSKNSIWFVHSADDEVAKIDKYDASTVRRLENAGAEDVHYTLYNCIIDSDGKYFDEDENVWQFSGHDSYIPIFRNQVDGLFAWLASHSLK